MMIRRTIIGVAVCLILGTFQGVPAKSWADETDRPWVSRVVSIQGHVLIKRKGRSNWQPASLEDTLFVGDQIRIAANSRAGIVLSNDAVLRLDQNTTLVFTEIERPSTFIFKLLKGAANFFSHRPRSLKIVTPFVNGVVEGTEFYVQVNGEQTRIDLFEGRILAQNVYGELQLSKGQGAVARAGQAPQVRILVHPRDSVQWALYYPPVLAVGSQEGPTGFREPIALYNQGRSAEALDRLDVIVQEDRDAYFYILRAGLLLNVGRVDKALEDIQHALTLDAANSEALALQAVIAVVQNRKDESLAAAQKAVQKNPRSAAAHMALSYAHQAGFNLPKALQAAQSAVSHARTNGTAWARLAELQLSTGGLDQGIASAHKAAALNPRVAHAHTILGFAYLTRIKTHKALEAFNQAIAFDSASPLPRLGRGLAKIRGGDLEDGRAQIEIAAGLDPDNALIRSYLGKAYFDEKRGPQDEQQFDIAKSLDPNDPTPWFYDAIRKQTINRPVEALRDMQRSIELNDNRAVYRSRFYLDDDLGARSAALGRLFSDLSFGELALQFGWRSLCHDPSNFSAHRLLADLYLHRPRHETARVSELLQSRLLQPLNLTPVQPQLAESNLLILEGAGPSEIGFNEYNPLFVRDRVGIGASAVAGGFHTLGDEVILSGLHQRFSYSLGQYHYETDGFRDNNDLEHNIYNGFVQAALSDKVDLQAEFRNKQTRSGDLRLRFDPDVFLPFQRNDIENRSARLGLHLAPGPRQDIIASVYYSDLEDRTTDRIETIGTVYQYYEDNTTDIEGQAFNGELQWLLQTDRHSLTGGAGHFTESQTKYEFSFQQLVRPPAEPEYTTTSYTTDLDNHHTNGYLYLNSSLFGNLEITCGLGFDSITSPLIKEEKWSPKIGLMWMPNPALTLRTAWFQTLKHPLVANQTIEPTHIVGFNQFFDDSDGTETERYGIGLDARIGTAFFSGIEATWRDADKPILNTATGNTQTEDLEEQQHHIYVYWIPADQLSITLEGWYESFKRSIYIPNKLQTYRVPISINHFRADGFISKFTATYIDQEVVDDSVTDNDQFWLLDTEAGYRLPNRMGVITLAVKNLLNTTINYYDINFSTGEPLAPLYWPDRLVLLQISLSF